MENTKLLDASTLYEQISKLIENKKLTVKKNINIELITMYWNIGHFLNQSVLKLNRGKYGLKTIKEVSNKLSLKYGPGFNRSSLFRMIQFSETFPDIEIVATLSQQLSWSHFIELVSIRNDLEREFYIVMCMNEGWSIRTLRERKKSLLFERTIISKKTRTYH